MCLKYDILIEQIISSKSKIVSKNTHSKIGGLQVSSLQLVSKFLPYQF